ncbi:hypothetical protein DAH55_20160 [Sphingomonas koreensis]|nr:hypothetical protein [Sphingomonas koreensis]PJI88476.1 hypothetical protein BDW16_1755 [Sphingomonas koreensis]RSU64160.1 hypothetical protein DAH55_20160 [Sphingomonas koreensis]
MSNDLTARYPSLLDRLASELFAPINGSYILSAARRLAAGYSLPRNGPSTEYDVLFNDLRLAPTAAFGVAPSEALGFPVQPEHFRGGERPPASVCFVVVDK